MADTESRSLREAGSVWDDLVELESRVRDAVRSRVLAASAGGLALSFVALQVPEARMLTGLLWVWWTLAGALLIGLASYGFQLLGARMARQEIRRTTTSAAGIRALLANMDPDPLRTRWPDRAERMLIVLSVVATIAGFFLLFDVGGDVIGAAQAGEAAQTSSG